MGAYWWADLLSSDPPELIEKKPRGGGYPMIIKQKIDKV